MGHSDFLARLDTQITGNDSRQEIQSALAAKFPGSEIRSLEAIGATVSGELFRAGNIEPLVLNSG